MNMTAASLMTINRFIYPTCASEVPERYNGEFFSANPEVYKLVVELAVQFKMSIILADADNKFYFCNSETGLIVGFGWVLNREYCFYSYTTKKAKGSDMEDRHTYRSIKLSYLISALKRAKINDTLSGLRNFGESAVQSLQTGLRIVQPPEELNTPEYKDSKFDGLDDLELEEVLTLAIRENPNTVMQSNRVKRYQDALNHYTKKNARKHAINKERAKFRSPRIVAVDCFDHLILANVSGDAINDPEKINISNIRRVPYKCIDQFAPELTFTFLLMRTQYENQPNIPANKMAGGAMPVMDYHNQALNALHYYITSLSSRSRSYAFLFLGNEE